MSSFRRNYVALGLLMFVRMSYFWPCDSLSQSNSSMTKIYEGRSLENVSISTMDTSECKNNSSRLKVVNVLSWPLNVSDYFDTVEDQQLDHVYVNTCGIPRNCQLQLSTLNDYYFFVSTPPRGNSPLLKRVLRKSESHSVHNGRILSSVSRQDKKKAKMKQKEGRPHLKLSTSQIVHVRINGSFNAKCYFSGKRSSFSSLVLHWLHNGEVLKRNIKIISNGISLRIKRVKKRNLGSYSCVAFKGSQLHASANVTIKAGKNKGNRRGHWKPCDQPNYCMHGGMCYFLPKLNRKLCRCKRGFEGIRCAEKKCSDFKCDGHNCTMKMKCPMDGPTINGREFIRRHGHQRRPKVIHRNRTRLTFITIYPT